MTQKLGFTPQFGDDDLRRAVVAGRRARNDRMHAQSARYNESRDGIEVVLGNGVTLFWPRHVIKEFAEISPSQMNNLCLSPRGTAMELESADVDIDIGGLVTDLVSTKEMAAALARHSRKTTSPQQAEAARKNGAKGGRPKKNFIGEMNLA